MVESKARCDGREGRRVAQRPSRRASSTRKEVEACARRNERCLGWIDRSEEGERDLAWSRDTLDLYKKQAEKLASAKQVVRERAASVQGAQGADRGVGAEKQKRDQQQRLRELNADMRRPTPAPAGRGVPSQYCAPAEIRGAKRKLVKARSDYNQDFQEQASCARCWTRSIGTPAQTTR